MEQMESGKRDLSIIQSFEYDSGDYMLTGHEYHSTMIFGWLDGRLGPEWDIPLYRDQMTLSKIIESYGLDVAEEFQMMMEHWKNGGRIFGYSFGKSEPSRPSPRALEEAKASFAAGAP